MTTQPLVLPAVDRAALTKVGRRVRERLEQDTSVYRVPVDRAEIFALSAFLDPAECARMIAMIDTVARPSTLYDPDFDPAHRTSYSGDLDPHDGFIRRIERRLCDLIGIDESWGETVQGQRYAPAQEFREHCDWLNVEADYWPGERNAGGQRSWTAMVYLNDVDEGGVTEFGRIGVTIPPQAGALLLWNNATPDGLVNHDTLHAGLPVVRGVKYIITKWFRTRRWG